MEGEALAECDILCSEDFLDDEYSECLSCYFPHSVAVCGFYNLASSSVIIREPMVKGQDCSHG